MNELNLSAVGIHITIALATLGGFASLLKWMVKAQLLAIKEALDELKASGETQGERIRQLELDFTEMKARLEARGCLGVADSAHVNGRC